MATNEPEPAEGGEKSASMNGFAIQAIRQRIAKQASRQEDFQLSMRVKTNPDEESVKTFQQKLIEFIQRKLEAGDVRTPEAVIALWDELNRMEEMLRKTSEEMDEEEMASNDESEGQDGDGTDASAINERSSMDDEGAESEADSGQSEDPAFH
ncbi:hypothetical protein [Halorubrum sp. SP9]|uniref:hypothetical protein n=1 Tax=Halorubrum sp. SP9 TaxID=1537267 RepID=UPI0010F96690|nr:hypothetical protein [Halorubrum sp. SP9]TKX67453.1 hypothetical protein EXE45_14280 [Halorubrum sp. SP9]